LSWRLLSSDGSLIPGCQGVKGYNVKPRSSRYRHGAAAVKAAVVGAMLVFVALTSTPACARDNGSGDSHWERLNRVLVIPPVYKPDAKAETSATADGCGNSRLSTGPGGAIVVAGTADCQNTNTPEMQAQGQGSGSTEASASSQPAASAPEQSAVPNTDQADSGSLGPPVGTIDDYQRQREAAAEASAALGAYQIPPSVVVGSPTVPYYLPRTYAAPAPPTTHVYVPTMGFARAPLASWMPRPGAPMPVGPPAWMPQGGTPMIAARPPMFIPPAVGSFGVTPGFGGVGGWRGR
jgi:hypothetical protein